MNSIASTNSFDGMAESEQHNRDCTHQLEQAEMKKKVLVEYTKPRKLKELQVEVEKARATELARQAEWEIEKARQDRLEKMIHRESPAADHQAVEHQRILALIERAIPVEQIRGKLAQLEKAEKPDDLLPKEIQDLTKELRAIVDESEALWSAGELAWLKPRIEEAARRATPAGAK